ncbi:distal tail protein Dit [Heyndrickxia coagulans]|uniref:Putative phage tail component, N-terminal domain-containing protein n=1 Tax=Heyndrickxia coagulans DSM 1 = ATCC 7050 TaxID=1121088 RepID=A0A0B5WNI3_HEYCO|nr:distal tail protein Dit [Heyndrickxia coagulans]AJH77480.1 phage tail family protein [Heyndrickxia coagulans DSM 1 = ATCC 7050]AJH78867.1 phage tail family protein [Heyndrickxia coagulans DSM 1 = ATCC 7050]MCR2847755.1 phage tail family protein [Heyndrickxia coagulans]MDR4225253.1 phage tail protein [Heyndrickxia coagulans DSM 1 = ATCC 7050]MED4492980.1 phage tail family protein [Heyndrickxia coagulans]
MTAIVSDTEFGFFYAGAHSREFNLKVIEIHRNIFPTVEEQTQNIPGMSGDLYLGTNVKNRTFVVDVEIVAGSHTQRIDLIHQISDWLMPVDDAEFDLIFDDEQDFTYYAHVSNITEVTRSLYKGKASITFSCSDPKGYGEYQQHDMTTNPITITPDGTAECYPIFTCMPKKDVTKIAITDEDGNYVYLGADVDPDTGDAPIDKEPLVFHDTCNTLANWTAINSSNITFELENGIPSGTMRSTANAIKVGKTSDGYADFGAATNDKKWHGPVRLQWLPNGYDDFRIRVRMWNRQYYSRARGKCEVYLLDSNGTRFGKIMLKDNGSSEEVYAQVQLGTSSSYKNIYYGKGNIKKGKKKTKTVKLGTGTKKVTEKGKSKTVQQWKTVKLDEDTSTNTFTDFYGYIELQKIGNKYRVEIMKFDDDSNPAWSKPLVYTYTDSSGKYAKQLAGIAFYTAKMDIKEDAADPVKHYTNNGMGLSDVKVWNIIDGGNGSSASPTTIAHKGDEIKINCEDRTVYKNGAIFMDKLYIGSNFPTLQGGVEKVFSFEPDLSDADWYYEYKSTTI